MMQNSFYNSYRAGFQTIADLSLQAFGDVLNDGTFKVLPLVGGRTPDINTAPGATAAFLVLRSLLMTTRETAQDQNLNNESLFQSQIVTVPSGAAGNQQSFLFANANWIKMLGFFSFGSGIVITIIEIDKNNGVYEGLIIPAPGTITTFGTLDVGQFYGPEGKSNFASGGGFNVRLTHNNSAGVKTYGLNFYGGKLQYDQYYFVVIYQDPYGRQYPLGAVPPTPFVLPLDIFIPTALGDSGSANYGNLLVQAISLSPTAPPYAPFITVSCYLTASLVYILPS